jgi:hypothetical protein
VKSEFTTKDTKDTKDRACTGISGFVSFAQGSDPGVRHFTLGQPNSHLTLGQPNSHEANSTVTGFGTNPAAQASPSSRWTASRPRSP